MELKSAASVSEFFQEVVSQAIRNQHVDTTTVTECYLVNLLATYATATLDGEPLGIKLAQAANAAPDERARQLKDVGDTSLYLTGFFGQALERKVVGPSIDYYIQVGGVAYGELARYFRLYREAREFVDIYEELGNKFTQFVDVLAEISEQTSVSSPASVVQLYERWLRTGSDWMERRLRQHGVVPKKESA
jgi:hypothetical protein